MLGVSAHDHNESLHGRLCVLGLDAVRRPLMAAFSSEEGPSAGCLADLAGV